MNNVMFALRQFVEHLVVKEKKNVRKNNNNKRKGEQIVTKAIIKTK